MCFIVCEKLAETEVPSVQVVQKYLVYHPHPDVHPTQMLPFLPDHRKIQGLEDFTCITKLQPPMSCHWEFAAEYMADSWNPLDSRKSVNLYFQ